MLAAVGGAGCALLVTGYMPVRYSATASLMIDQKGSADQLSQQRVKSYARLVTSRRVLLEVAVAEHLDPAALAGNVRAEAVPGTVLLQAIATDSDPARAARVANRIGDELSGLIHTLENRSAIGVTVIDLATAPTRPVSPRPPLNIAAGIVLGLVFAYGFLMLRSRLDTTIADSDDLAAAIGAPTLGVIGRNRRHPAGRHRGVPRVADEPAVRGGGRPSALAAGHRAAGPARASRPWRSTWRWPSPRRAGGSRWWTPTCGGPRSCGIWAWRPRWG